MNLSNVLSWTAGLSTGLAIGSVVGCVMASRRWRDHSEKLNREWKRLFEEQHRQRMEMRRERRRSWEGVK